MKTYTIKKDSYNKLGYILFPYAGGQKTAVHDMHIELGIDE